ncbi:hypothetical protein PVAP13_3NG201250 [Panicum virgatum]|uniref:Uncharacterized protein n=1 Tax=Panicum virgatum TaxID=38727 RepID=A0A8T0UJ40_PANVG|nr:hypothetical protein PVAP13_3NG201250 [Panicum virgatum]
MIKVQTRRHRQAQSISRLTHCPSVQHPIHRSLPHYSPRVRGFGARGRPVAGERAHRRGLGAAGGVSTSAEGMVARRQELRSTGGGTLGDHCGTAGGRRRSTCCGLRSATASVPAIPWKGFIFFSHRLWRQALTIWYIFFFLNQISGISVILLLS